ncbi:MAG: ArsC family transcriptional regulator, partial [Peptococcaceae bacterium]|nr:ArsC family transcriptional regulator [Peptococcaceae bacterium]
KLAVGLNNLLDTTAKAYTQLNMDRITSSSVREELLFNHPSLYKTPIVRNGKQASVGYAPETWQTWE